MTGGAYLEVEGLRKKGQRPFDAPTQLGIWGALEATQRVQSTVLVRVQRAKPPEAQRSYNIISKNLGLKSYFASCCKVRYKGASRLCSDKKHRIYVYNKYKMFFKQDLIYKSSIQA